MVKSIAMRNFFSTVGFATVWAGGGLFFRALIQAIYLVVISRSMGAEGYGGFAGIVAVAILLSPLSGWGVTHVLTKKMSSENALISELLPAALVQILISGTLMLVGVVAIGCMFDIDIFLLLLIGISELILLPVALMVTNIGILIGRNIFASLSSCLVPMFRLLGLLLALAFLNDFLSVRLACQLYFFGTLCGSFVLLFFLIRRVGPLTFSSKIIQPDLFREGNRYAAGALVSSGFMEVDKVIILSLLGATALGPYAVAFRVASVFVLPIAAFGSVILPRLFSSKNNYQFQRLFRLSLILSVIYGFIVAVLIWFSAPMILNLFGKEFVSAITYIEVLSLWPMFHALRYILGIGLIGIGLNLSRVSVEFFGLILVVSLNLYLIPINGVTSAIYSLLIVEVLMAFSFGLIMLRRKNFLT